MRIKTSELTGAALDWAVAKCEDLPLKLDPMGFRKDAPASMQAGWWVWDGEGQNQVIGHRKTRRGDEDGYSPSADWAQGGPIIEREEIGLQRNAPCSFGREWEARGSIMAKGAGYQFAYGPTPLIAAMRCYVASKLGDDIDIPEELTP